MAGEVSRAVGRWWTSVVWVLGVFGLVVLAVGPWGVAVLVAVMFVWAVVSEWLFPTGDDGEAG